MSQIRSILQSTSNEISTFGDRVPLPLRVFLVKHEARCLLVASDADHISNEPERSVFGVIAMNDPARIDAA